jgi:glycosyltransferase involved in cell wall biosynthesis
MKTLLLTDIPPSSNLTAGIVTAQMCRFVGLGELAIFCVQNPHLKPQLYDDLATIPIRVVRKPNEQARRQLARVRIGRPGAAGIEMAKRLIIVPRLVREAVQYGREQEVMSVWAILQGQTMVRMARKVASGLNVPLRVQIWDPLSWWLRAHRVDPINRYLDEILFDRTMQTAVSCAAASPPMARHYTEHYGTPSEIIIASLDPSVARQPAPHLRIPGELAIGMAGQFYANDEWNALVRALDRAGWQVSGRKVVLRVMGHDYPKLDVSQGHLDFLGWQPQEKVVGILSDQCDLLYCPYPYAADMAPVAKMSFPSKIPTYLAAGRPIVFHGPDYAAPASYLRERNAGFVARALEPDAIYDALLVLTEDVDRYEQLAKGAQAAFLADFTLDRMKLGVRRFLGYAD